MRFEKTIIDIIEGNKRAPLIANGLLGVSYLFRLAVGLKNAAYSRRWITAKRASLPVISIGNFVAGGTGKTPLTALLAKTLSAQCKVAILTRGFRSQLEHSGQSMNISRNEGLSLSAAVCGDEPRWLAQQVAEADVWVGKNRVAAASSAAIAGAEVAILDDGMQYRRLARDFEIVVVDANDPFGKEAFLPRGYLRDEPHRLAQANLVVINGAADEKAFYEIQDRIARLTSAPVVGMRMSASRQEDIAGKTAAAFCAIAKPERFFRLLEQSGCRIIDKMTALDHTSFSMVELETFAEQSRRDGAEILVCTEKDAVKLPIDLKLCLPILVLKTHLKICNGQEHWDRLIARIKVRISDERRI